MPGAQANTVLSPNQGLYLGRTPVQVPARGLQDGMNFRIKEGRVNNLNLGWAAFSAKDFGNPITLIDTFTPRGVSGLQIIGTTEDLFKYDRETDTPLYINARYEIGTIDVTGTAVTVNTGTPAWETNEVKAGDYISIGATGRQALTDTWIRITEVTNTTLTLASSGGTATNQAYTIRRTFQGDLTTPWVTRVFVQPDDGTGDDLWFATNGVDWVVTWDGTATQVVRQSALGFTAKYLEVYKNMMIYAHIGQSGDVLPTSFINSDIGQPLDVSSGLSEQFRIIDTTDEIITILNHGDNVAFYARDRVVLAQFVGDPLVFIFRTVTNNVGLIGTRLIADFGDYHEFIGGDSQYLFDGVTVNEINSHVWREVLRTRDPVRAQAGFTVFDETNGELIWAVPLTSDTGVGDEDEGPEVAYTEHYLETLGEKVPTPFSKRAFPFTATGISQQLGVLTWDEISEAWEDQAFRWNDTQLFSGFPLILVGDEEGELFSLNSAHTADGTALTPTYVRTGRKVVSDRRMRGMVTRVYPFASDTGVTWEVTLRMFDHISGPVTITDEQDFDASLPEGGHFTVHYRRGRLYDLQFGSEAGSPWEIEGYDVDLRAGGFR